jgi:hypothetical protein
MIQFGSSRCEVAALPPDVRKGSAFPAVAFLFLGATPGFPFEAQPLNFLNTSSEKAQSFRISGGIGATKSLRHRPRLDARKVAPRLLTVLAVILFICAAAISQEIPEGVIYKAAPESVNAAAKSALQTSLASESFPEEMFGDVMVCGPMLWKALKPSADKVLLGAKPVMALITDPESIHAEGKRIMSADERKAFWTLWRNKYPALKNANIRKARADELSFYWATIPFDIEEPLFVVDTNSERFIVHLLNKQPKITLFWIELVGDLRTLKTK